jgi:hypothetical protein
VVSVEEQEDTAPKCWHPNTAVSAALAISRAITVRLLPPRFAGGIRGSISALLIGQVARMAQVVPS